MTGNFGVLRLSGGDTGRPGSDFRPTFCTRGFGESLAIFISLEGRDLSMLSVGRNASLHYVVVTKDRSLFVYGSLSGMKSRNLLIMLPDRPEISFSGAVLQPLPSAGLNRATTAIELNGVLCLPAGDAGLNS